MNRLRHQIDKAESTLSLLRENSSEFSDFEALRNLVEISRQRIIQAVSQSGIQPTIDQHSALIKKTFYLSELLNQNSTQLLPGSNSLTINFNDFLSRSTGDLTIDSHSESQVSADLETNIDAMLIYFDNSFSNVDQSLEDPNLALHSIEQVNLNNFQLEIAKLDYQDCLEEIVQIVSRYLNFPSLTKVFAQLFEANRVLFRHNLISKDLQAYVTQQDLLYNAFSDFKLAQNFYFANSPVGSISPINQSTLKLLLSNPDLAEVIITQTTQALAYKWLKISIEELFANFSEKFIRDVIDVSGIYSQSNFDQRYSISKRFENTAVQGFVNNAVEIGAQGSCDLPHQIADDFLYQKYNAIIDGLIMIMPYNVLKKLEVMIFLNPLQSQFRRLQIQVVQEVVSMGFKERQLIENIIQTIKSSHTFRSLLSQKLETALVIH